MGTEYTVQYLCLALAVIFACMLGLMIHSFIVAVNITDWMKRRPVTTIDQILLWLGFSRVAYQSAGLIDVFSAVTFASNISILKDNMFIHILYLSSNSCSLWLSSLLSVVFCLKISNFHNVFLLRAKIFFLRNVVSLIVFLALYSLVYAVIGSWSLHSQTRDFPLDRLNNISDNNCLQALMRVFYAMGHTPPFLLNCVSTIFVLVSLCLHLKRMKSTRYLTTHLDTYYIAIKAIISCFLSFCLQVITNLIIMYYGPLIDSLCFYVSFYFFPALHSVFLISIITKLRNQYFRILHCTVKCLSIRRTKNQIRAITE